MAAASKRIFIIERADDFGVLKETDGITKVIIVGNDQSLTQGFYEIANYLSTLSGLTLVDIGAQDLSGHNVGVSYDRIFEGIKLILGNKSLRTLKLRTRKADFEIIEDDLAHNDHLEFLQLTDYTSTQVLPVFRAMSHNKCLTELIFNHTPRTNYTYDDLEYAFECLECNTTLQRLTYNIDIDIDEGEHIAIYFMIAQYLPGIERLNFLQIGEESEWLPGIIEDSDDDRCYLDDIETIGQILRSRK